MALTQEIMENSELIKNHVLNSTWSDNYKQIYLKLIKISTEATNGISADEKLQKMTECIQLLAVTQGLFLTDIDDKINRSIKLANNKKCNTCESYTYYTELKKEKEKERIIDEYKKQNKDHESSFLSEENVSPTLKIIGSVCMSPFVWIFLSVAVFSPFADGIVKTVVDCFK